MAKNWQDFSFPKMRVPIPFLAALALTLLTLFMSMRIGQVTASEIGVLINNITGKVQVILEPGSFFYNDLTGDLYTIDKTVHTLRMRSDTGDEVRIKTKDGSDVRLDVEINYSLLLDEKTILNSVLPESGVKKVATVIHTRGRRRSRTTKIEEAYQAKWIRDYSRAVVRYVFGSLSTDDFYDATLREEKAREAEKELNRVLGPHGLRITKVLPDKFRFYEEYEEKIREKKEADQEVEKQKELAKAAIERQKKEIVQATKKAEVTIEKTKGELEQQLIEAEAQAVKDSREAEAYAYTRKTKADADYFKAVRDAKAILAAAKAEAESLANMVKALEGEGGRNLVLRSLAAALSKARIEGQPYATNAMIQKVLLEGDRRGGGK